MLLIITIIFKKSVQWNAEVRVSELLSPKELNTTLSPTAQNGERLNVLPKVTLQKSQGRLLSPLLQQSHKNVAFAVLFSSCQTVPYCQSGLNSCWEQWKLHSRRDSCQHSLRSKNLLTHLFDSKQKEQNTLGTVGLWIFELCNCFYPGWKQYIKRPEVRNNCPDPEGFLSQPSRCH